MKSLETKFNSINTETAKFNACVKKIRDLNESGTSEANIIHKALTLYKTEHGKNKNFFLIHALLGSGERSSSFL